MKLTKITSVMQRSVQLMMEKHAPLVSIVSAISHEGGRALLVGGAVRDLFLELPIKDIDIEVHGLTYEQLEKILKTFGLVDYVGKTFGVLRLHGLGVDWSLPRKDEPGRKPVVAVDPYMALSEAFRRRDLTINAMGIDLVTYELIDPFNGYQDLQDGILRAPDPAFFVEDPLRFYRVMQFIGRFSMSPDAELNALCEKIDMSTVSVERIEKEFEKLLLQSKQPSRGIRWLHERGRLSEVLPEVAVLVGIEQDSIWHPEGDVFEHTMQTLDAAAQMDYSTQQQKLICLYAALCHDLGKVSTTYEQAGRIKSTGHADVGVPLAKQLLARITRKKDVIKTAAKLVRYHMAPAQFVTQQAGPAAYKRLAAKLAPYATLRMVGKLAYADILGRNPQKGRPLSKTVELIEEFFKRAETYAVIEHKETPLLYGRDFLDIVQPGPQLGELVKQAYALQLADGIRDKQELKQRVLDKIHKKSK